MAIAACPLMEFKPTSIRVGTKASIEGFVSNLSIREEMVATERSSEKAMVTCPVAFEYVMTPSLRRGEAISKVESTRFAKDTEVLFRVTEDTLFMMTLSISVKEAL